MWMLKYSQQFTCSTGQKPTSCISLGLQYSNLKSRHIFLLGRQKGVYQIEYHSYLGSNVGIWSSIAIQVVGVDVIWARHSRQLAQNHSTMVVSNDVGVPIFGLIQFHIGMLPCEATAWVDGLILLVEAVIVEGLEVGHMNSQMTERDGWLAGQGLTQHRLWRLSKRRFWRRERLHRRSSLERFRGLWCRGCPNARWVRRIS